jgi:hypothetical protein
MEIIGIKIESVSQKKKWLVNLYFGSNVSVILPQTNTLQKKEHIVDGMSLYILSFSPQDKQVTAWLVKLLQTHRLTVANNTPEQQATIAALHHLNQRNQILASIKKAAIFLLLTTLAVAAVTTAPFWLPFFIPSVAIIAVASILVAIPLITLSGLGIKWLFNRENYQLKNILTKLKRFIVKVPEQTTVISPPSPSIDSDSTSLDTQYLCAIDVDSTETNSISTDEGRTIISCLDFFAQSQKQDPNLFIIEKDKSYANASNVPQDTTSQQQTESDLNFNKEITSSQKLELSAIPETQINTQILTPIAVVLASERPMIAAVTPIGVNDVPIETIETPVEENAKSITEQLTPLEVIQTHIINMQTPQGKTSVHIIDMLTPTEAESSTTNHSSIAVDGIYVDISYQENNANRIDMLVKITDPHKSSQFKTPTKFTQCSRVSPWSSPRIVEIDENITKRNTNTVCRKLNF